MALLPSANVAIDDTAGAFAGNTGYLVVLGCCEKNADNTPRVFTSVTAMLAQHGYSQALDYCAYHFDETKLPVIFLGLPTAVAGTIGRQNSTGVLGTSVITATAGSNGVLEEVDAKFTVVNGGTIGTSGITGNLSLDGGRTIKLIRLITNSAYVIPYYGITLNFGAGTLLAGDVYTFSTTAPMWDGTGMANARTALAGQMKLVRSFMVIGDMQDAPTAGYVTSAVNSYETANNRFVYARTQVRDRLPVATKATVTKTMVGAPSLTFAAAGFTITRASGSFLTEGWAVGDVPTITGTTSNNGGGSVRGAITAVTATVMTFASGIVNEGPIGTAVITGSEGLTFTTTTATRSTGSWIADGFRVGDTVTISGTASNNGTKVITALSATVLTFASGGAAEVIGSYLVTTTKGETFSAYVSLMDTTFASVDAQKRIDIGIGRARKSSPLTQLSLRRPIQWPLSIREYQHDVQIPCWRKADGPLIGWDLQDSVGNSIVEYDERVVGGALAARFTCARTYGNGPNGAFGALSLTRMTEGSLLSRTHNMAVANVACTVVQASTENAIGTVLQLNSAGQGTDQSLGQIEEAVNTDLNAALMQNKGEGPRASSAVWRASRTDILSTPGASLTGVLSLRLNGTLEQINTTVKITSG